MSPASLDRDNERSGDVAWGGGQRAELWLFVAILLYFAGKAIFLALRIGENIFPDEESWFGLSQLFATTFLLPVDSPLSYKFGLIAHSPNLYFWLMGRALSLNCFPISDLVFLRLVNVCFGVVTVGFGWRLARLLLRGLACRLLFFLLLTNTMMFTFLNAAVSYDNLTNLCAVLALYYLLVFFRARTAVALLRAAVFLFLGSLVKLAFLPYALALLLVTVVHERNSGSVFFLGLRNFFQNLRGTTALLALLVFLLAGANLSLYGGNYLRYRQLVPTMEKVLPLEACLKNRIVTRNYVVANFKNGKFSLLDAQRLALRIRNPGDRQDALFMLQQAGLEKAGQTPPRLGVFAYSRQWVATMLARTYGVAGHLVMVREGWSLAPYYVIFALAGLLAVVKFRPSALGGVAPYLLGVVGFYAGILFGLVGYQNYTSIGLVGVALTGRYLFPVLVPFYLLLSYYLLDRMPRWWQWGMGGLVAVFFVLAEFPWFLQHVTPEWYF